MLACLPPEKPARWAGQLLKHFKDILTVLAPAVQLRLVAPMLSTGDMIHKYHWGQIRSTGPADLAGMFGCVSGVIRNLLLSVRWLWGPLAAISPGYGCVDYFSF